MNRCAESETRRSSKWPLITFFALLGAGALAYAVAKRRSAQAAEGVDDLLYVCENFTGALERRLNGNLTTLAS